MTCWRAWGAAVLGLLVPLAAGCGDPNGRRAISGAVLFRGQPLDGKIEFEPTTEKGVQAGAVVTHGRYAIPKDKGLVPGSYKVLVFSPDNKDVEPDPGGNPFFAKAKERIPAKYNAQTTLTCEVKSGGANTFDFALD